MGIYLHEFTNNEFEISSPHSAASCGIENFDFIVSKRVQINLDNSRAMTALHSGVLNLHHDNDVKEVVSSQPSIT